MSTDKDLFTQQQKLAIELGEIANSEVRSQLLLKNVAFSEFPNIQDILSKNEIAAYFNKDEGSKGLNSQKLSIESNASKSSACSELETKQTKSKLGKLLSKKKKVRAATKSEGVIQIVEKEESIPEFRKESCSSEGKSIEEVLENKKYPMFGNREISRFHFTSDENDSGSERIEVPDTVLNIINKKLGKYHLIKNKESIFKFDTNIYLEKNMSNDWVKDIENMVANSQYKCSLC